MSWKSKAVANIPRQQVLFCPFHGVTSNFPFVRRNGILR